MKLTLFTLFVLSFLYSFSQTLIYTGNREICLGDTAEIGIHLAYDTIYYYNGHQMLDTIYIPDDSDMIAGNGITDSAIFSFNVTSFGNGMTFTNINKLEQICLDIEHSYVGDVDIYLICPNNQFVELIEMDQPGGTSADFGYPITGVNPAQYGTPETYCWSPSALNPPITNSTVFNQMIPPGSYQPSGNWNDLLGCPLNGTWKIVVLDDWGGDDGFMFGANLSFQNAPTDSILNIYDSHGNWLPNTDIVSNINSNEISILPNSVGTHFYSYYIVDMFGDSLFVQDSLTVSDIQLDILASDSVYCFNPIQLSPIINGNILLDSCQYSLRLNDSWGDGWTGAKLTLSINGVIDTILSVPFGMTTLTYYFKLADIAQLELSYSTGSFENENSYILYDGNQNVLFSDGPNPSSGLVYDSILTCQDVEYNWSPNYNLSYLSSNTVEVEPFLSTTYQLEVIIDGFCSKIQTIEIKSCNTDLGSFSICENDSLLLNGNYYFAEGLYFDTLQTLSFTDSIIYFHLSFMDIVSSEIDSFQICQNNSFEYNGNFYINTGLYLDTISNLNGCDSIYRFHLANSDTVINGFITNNLNLPIISSMVYLLDINATEGSIIIIDSTLTDASGYYSFSNNVNGSFLKVVPDIALFPNEIPSYYLQSAVIQTADSLVLFCDTSLYNFSTISSLNLGGTGIIGGIVGNGVGKKSGVGFPIPGLSLVLMNENMEVVKQTLTDIQGKFTFNDLEQKTFSIWVDKPSIKNNLAPMILLSEVSVQDDLEFILREDYLELKTNVSIKNISESNFSIFPNPTNGLIYIQSENLDFEIQVFSILGEKVLEKTKQNGNIELDLSEIQVSEGTYVLKISNKDGNYFSKIVYR